MALTCLTTARAVVTALGGIAAVCELTGSNPKTVSAWQAIHESFPPNVCFVMMAALYSLGYTAPARLWRQVEADGITLVPLEDSDETTHSV